MCVQTNPYHAGQSSRTCLWLTGEDTEAHASPLSCRWTCWWSSLCPAPLGSWLPIHISSRNQLLPSMTSGRLGKRAHRDSFLRSADKRQTYQEGHRGLLDCWGLSRPLFFSYCLWQHLTTLPTWITAEPLIPVWADQADLLGPHDSTLTRSLLLTTPQYLILFSHKLVITLIVGWKLI